VGRQSRITGRPTGVERSRALPPTLPTLLDTRLRWLRRAINRGFCRSVKESVGMQPFVPHSDKRAWDRSKLGQYARTDWINAAQEMAFGDQLIEVECVKQSALMPLCCPIIPNLRRCTSKQRNHSSAQITRAALHRNDRIGSGVSRGGHPWSTSRAWTSQ
jgi:hypothetical protein